MMTKTRNNSDEACLPIDGESGLDVKLLDGRTINLLYYQRTRILDTDDLPCTIDTSNYDLRNPLHLSFYKTLLIILSSRTLKTSSTISISINKLIEKIGFKTQIIDENHLPMILQFSVGIIAQILSVLRRIKAAKMPGLSPKVEAFLEEDYKWEERGYGLYFALITNDPLRGALTDQELRSLHNELNKSYSENRISLIIFTLCWFFLGLGLRPIQAARMKRSDVQITSGPEGNEVILRIPLGKGRGGHQTEHWIRRAPTAVAECLIRYLKSPLYKNIPDNSKLFNLTSNHISSKIIYTFSKLNTWSDRLEDQIPINVYRFRYTLATRAILDGASDMEVARLLTHRSLTCIRFYRASMPDLQRPIKEALGQELSIIASTFQGKIINDLSEATRQNDDFAVIRDFARLIGQPLGACGTRALCHQNAPLACIHCYLFEPFTDAPWEELSRSVAEDKDKEWDGTIKQIYDHILDGIDSIISARDHFLMTESNKEKKS